MPEADRRLLVGRRARRPARRSRRSGVAAGAAGALAVSTSTTSLPSARAPCRRSRRPTPVPVPPLVMENGARRLHAPTAASTSSCSTANARRRCRGRTCWRTPTFGTIVSASGSAFTWAGNSRENRLTPFANDPIDRSDRRGDLPARRGVRRGLGRHAGAAAAAAGRRPLGHPSRRRASRGISTPSPASSRSWRSSCAPDDPVKLAVLTLTNTSATSRGASACSATSSGAWGRRVPASAGSSSPRSTRRPARSVARNAYNTEFGERVAFWHATRAPRARTPAIAASSSDATAR